jgi:hypothetical protein
MTSILICNNSLNTPIEFENTDHIYSSKIYLLYDAKVINPPFFNTIIVTRDDLIRDELMMIYNMLLINGKLIMHKKYKSYFKESIHYNNNYVIFTKYSNKQHIFPNNRTVEFIIAGVQKAGTTALSINIGKHPDIYIDIRKDPFKTEVHFFDIFWKKGISFYKKMFNYSKKIVGEKTPDLIYLPYTFPLIQSVNPYVKIIIILRNPIERAFSAWKFTKKYFGEARSFEQSIQQELENIGNINITFYTSATHYLQRGLYYKQISELLKWFPMQNILVLISEQVKLNMSNEYDKVFNFLNVKSLNHVYYDIEFESDDKSSVSEDLYNELFLFYKQDIQLLEELLNIKTGWEKTRVII